MNAPALYCAQRTDEPPAELAAFLAAEDGAARRWQGRLAVDEPTNHLHGAAREMPID